MDRPGTVILRTRHSRPSMLSEGVAAASLLLILLATPGRTLAADGELVATSDLPSCQLIASEQPDSAVPQLTPLWTTAEPGPDLWTIDYKFRSVSSSKTSYEFGTPDPAPYGWAPLSRLEFPMDSCWHGLQVGLRTQEWELHFEWLTPVKEDIHGTFEDYDWQLPDADFTDLGLSRARWLDGQSLDLGLNVLLWDRLFNWPVDLWATGGFRWQRLNIMAYDAVQVKENDIWPVNPYSYPGDVISFDQQYWLTYLGGQLRTVLNLPVGPPIHWTFQGDWANAQAYNVDHHLLREGDRYTMEKTHGDAFHLALTAEAPLTTHITCGLQFDYLQIRTTGSHHYVNHPIGDDYTWTNGVRVWSDQTWLTAFAGFRF